MKWIIRTLVAVFGVGTGFFGLKAIKERKDRKEFERTMKKAKEALEKNRSEIDAIVKSEDEKTKKIIREMEQMISEMENNSDIFECENMDLIRYRG